MATSAQLLKDQKAGAKIMHNGSEVEYLPRRKGDRKPWACEDASYAASECTAVFPVDRNAQAEDLAKASAEENAAAEADFIREVEPKIWNSNVSHSRIHVFLNGHAKCGSSDKQNVSPMHTRSDGQVFVEDTPGLTFCEDCEAAFLAAEKNMAARKARMVARTGAPFTPTRVVRVLPRNVRHADANHLTVEGAR